MVLENHILALKDTLDLQGVSYDGVKVQTSKEKGSGIEEKIASKVNLDQQIIDMRNVELNCLESVQELINEINDDHEGNLKLVLSEKYIKGGSWRTIAERINFSKSWTERLHQKALKEAEKVLEKRKKIVKNSIK